MGLRKGNRSALWLAVAVAAATLVPYLVAIALARPHGVFSGFLLNPVDGYSYLAKMRQGASGEWLFRLPYTADPGPGTLLYLFYLFLGHLAAWTGLPLLAVYHAARALGAVVMFLAAYRFYRQVLPRPEVYWTAYLLTLLGSGLGWLLLPLGLLSPDLWVPEAIPFLTAYTNAHFPWAAASILGGLNEVVSCLGTRRYAVSRILVAAVWGSLLGILQPFAVVTTAAVLGAWLLVEAMRARGQPALRQRSSGPGLAAALAFVAGALPWAAYAAWTTRFHPVLSGWTAQNQTPSPSPLLVALGYGVVLLLALVGLGYGRAQERPTGRLLLAWAVVNTLLLYAPFDLQRRFYLGLFFPFAGLAGFGLEAWARGSHRWVRRLVIVLALAIPSNLVVIAVGVAGVGRGEPALVVSPGDDAAYRWLGEHAEPGALVLASPEAGNRIPAYADVRVLYGHPFETPQAEAQRALVERLLSGQEDASSGIQGLRDLGVRYVVYGPGEARFGSPAWLASLPVVAEQMGVRVYDLTMSPCVDDC